MTRLTLTLCLVVTMAITAFVAERLRPTEYISRSEKPFVMASAIPESFADWKMVPQQVGGIINPEVKQSLSKLYTQTLNRAYTNTDGVLIMLSISYGEDQSDAKSVHYPEVCYSAQGYQVTTPVVGVLKTHQGLIRVKRLYAEANERAEPITYWTTVGHRVVVGPRESKIEQLSYGLRGQIPDGLLFRVSSLDKNKNHAYQMHETFVNDLLDVLPPHLLSKLAGINT